MPARCDRLPLYYLDSITFADAGMIQFKQTAQLIPLSKTEVQVIAVQPQRIFDGPTTQEDWGFSDNPELVEIVYSMVFLKEGGRYTEQFFKHKFMPGGACMEDFVVYAPEGDLIAKYGIDKKSKRVDCPYNVLQFIA